MRKLLALGLAALIGAGAITATASSASAHQGYYNHWGYAPYYGAPYGWQRPPLAYLYFGTPILGFGLRTPYFHGGGWGSNGHVAWCSQRYRTYNPATDTYFARRGVAARCVSPGW